MILTENDSRYTMFPIQHQRIWELYKQSIASFWSVEEVDLSQDRDDFEALKDSEKHFLTHVLAFFAASDGIVLENLAIRFMKDVEVSEVRAFYGFQIAMENIHSEMYSVLIDTFVRDPIEKDKLFRATETLPVVAKKAEWAIQWIESPEASFATRLIAFVCVEGIFFSGSFCAIYWLKKRGKMPGLTFSNELISRDEGLHCTFACELYNLLSAEERTITEDSIVAIFRDAVAIEKEFITEALSVDLIGMNAREMSAYIEYVADHWLTELGCAKVWNTKNPFDWMEMISLQGKTNMFEKRIGDYQKASITATGNYNQFQFNTDEDF